MDNALSHTPLLNFGIDFHHISGMLHHLLTLRNNSKRTSLSLNELGVLNCINALHHVVFYINFVVCNVMRGLCNLHDPPASCNFLFYCKAHCVVCYYYYYYYYFFCFSFFLFSPDIVFVYWDLSLKRCKSINHEIDW